MKSEPDVFSIDDLKKKKRTMWEGVRNYQARNFMRDAMKKGDKVLYYHSNCKEPGIVGLGEILTDTAYPDPTQFDENSNYFDPKATKEKPRWMLVDVGFVEKFDHEISLKSIKENPELNSMKVAQKGMRLSIQPVDKSHFDKIIQLK